MKKIRKQYPPENETTHKWNQHIRQQNSQKQSTYQRFIIAIKNKSTYRRFVIATKTQSINISSSSKHNQLFAIANISSSRRPSSVRKNGNLAIQEN